MFCSILLTRAHIGQSRQTDVIEIFMNYDNTGINIQFLLNYAFKLIVLY